MKLYFSPGACSLSPHIVLREAGFEPELAKVDLKTKQLADGGDFLAVNPKGYVPALQLDDGSVLTEGPAIVQYVADLRPEAGLLPPAGTLERARAQEWLNYISSEIHKSYSALFNPTASEDWKQAARANILRRVKLAEELLSGQEYLMGERMGVADAYLFTTLNWARLVDVDLSSCPALLAFRRRVAARPAVQAALKAEGLLG